MIYTLTGGNGPLDLAVDSAGNAVVAGSFRGMNLGDGAVGTPAQPGSAFIAKLAGDSGKLLWKRLELSSSPSAADAVAVDPSDSVVAPLADLEQYDSMGSLTWTASTNGTDAGFVFVDSLAVAADGSPLVFGRLYETVTIPPTQRVASDAANNITLFGAYGGSLDLDGSMLQSAGMADLFLAQLDPGGSLIWSKSFGDAATYSAGEVAIDPTGAVLITGTAHGGGTIDFGSGPLSAGAGDAGAGDAGAPDAVFFAKFPKP